MRAFIYLVILSLISHAGATKTYVKGIAGCSTSCSGSISDPFDNLWTALKQATIDQEIVLLKGGAHYLLDSSISNSQILSNSQGYTYIYATSKITVNSNITVKPLFCDEEEGVQYPSLCYLRSESSEIFLKSDTFVISINGNLTLHNLILNGREDIAKFNSPSANLTDCILNSKHCCDGKRQESFLFENIKCSRENIYFDETIAENALFDLSSSGSLTIRGCSFEHIYGIMTLGLIYYKPTTSLSLADSKLYSVNFPRGIIYTPENQVHTSSSKLEIKNLTIDSFNHLKFTQFKNTYQTSFISISSKNNDVISVLFSDISLINTTLEKGKKFIQMENINPTFKNTLLSNISFETTANSNLTDIFYLIGCNTTFWGFTLKDSKIMDYTRIITLYKGSELILLNALFMNNMINSTIDFQDFGIVKMNFFEDKDPYPLHTIIDFENISIIENNIYGDGIIFDFISNSTLFLNNLKILNNTMITPSIKIGLKLFAISGSPLLRGHLTNIYVANNYLLGDKVRIRLSLLRIFGGNDLIQNFTYYNNFYTGFGGIIESTSWDGNIMKNMYCGFNYGEKINTITRFEFIYLYGYVEIYNLTFEANRDRNFIKIWFEESYGIIDGMVMRDHESFSYLGITASNGDAFYRNFKFYNNTLSDFANLIYIDYSNVRARVENVEFYNISCRNSFSRQSLAFVFAAKTNFTNVSIHDLNLNCNTVQLFNIMHSTLFINNFTLKNSNFNQGKLIAFYSCRLKMSMMEVSNLTMRSNFQLLAFEFGTPNLDNVKFSDFLIDDTISLKLFKSCQFSINKFNFTGLKIVDAPATQISIGIYEVVRCLDSQGKIENFYIEDTTKLLKIETSSLQINDIFIKRFNRKEIENNIASIQSSTVSIVNLYIDFEAEMLENLNIFSLFQSDLSINNSNIMNIYGISGYLFYLIQKSTLRLNNFDFSNIETTYIGAIISQNLGSLYCVNGTMTAVPKILEIQYNSQISIKNLSSLVNNALIENAISIYSSDIIEIIDSSFEHGYDSKDKLNLQNYISIENSKSVIFMKNCIVKNIISLSSAILILYNNPVESTQINIINTLFYNNTAEGNSLGGALRIEDLYNAILNIKNSTFDLNSVKGKFNSFGRAGALYYKASTRDSNLLMKFTIEDSIFTNNKAEFAGGAIYVYNFKPTFRNNVFRNNTLSDNTINHVGGYISEIKIGSSVENYNRYTSYVAYSDYRLLQEDSDSLASINAISGQGLEKKSFYILIFDCFGQIKKDDDISLLTIDHDSSNFSNEYAFQNSIKTSFSRSGLFNLSEIIFTAPPHSNQSIFLTISGDFVSSSPVDPKNFTKSINLNFRRCQLGEIITSVGGCQSCQDGYTQLDPLPTNLSECKICLESMDCRANELVVPRSGYSRLNMTSDIFLRCRIENVCLGGRIGTLPLKAEGYCDQRHLGLKCDNCKEGYGKIRDDLPCIDCSRTFEFYLSVICSVLFLFFFIRKMYKYLMEVQEYGHQEIKPINKLVFFKKLFNFSQILIIISNFNILWPIEFRNLINIIEGIFFTKFDAFSLDCIFNIEKPQNRKLFQLILANLVPAIYLIFSLIAYTWNNRNKREKINKNALISFIESLIPILWFIFAPAIIQENLSLAACFNVYRQDDPVYALSTDSEILCFTETHIISLIIFTGIFGGIWAFVIPLIYLKLNKQDLRRKNSKIHRISTLFLISGFQESFFAGEMAIFLFKLVLIILNIFTFKRFYIDVLYFSIIVIYLAHKANSMKLIFSSRSTQKSYGNYSFSQIFILFQGLMYQEFSRIKEIKSLNNFFLITTVLICYLDLIGSSIELFYSNLYSRIVNYLKKNKNDHKIVIDYKDQSKSFEITGNMSPIKGKSQINSFVDLLVDVKIIFFFKIIERD